MKVFLVLLHTMLDLHQWLNHIQQGLHRHFPACPENHSFLISDTSIWCSPTPTLGQIRVYTTWRNCNQKLNRILSCFRKAIGSLLCRIVYLFFSRPISRSTWIRTLERRLDSSTSFTKNCFFPLVNEGISNFAPYNTRSSLMVKARSARITSPFSSLSRKPQLLVIHQSHARPP